MISRLAIAAAVIAAIATASLTLAASLPRVAPASRSAAKPAEVVQLERVVITAKRLPEQPR
jgi:Flp pilus assembly protein CpaB